MAAMPDLTDALLDWYDEHARELPWRGAVGEPVVGAGLASSCSSRRRSPGSVPVHEEWLRALAHAGRPGRRDRRARRSAPGAGSATRAGRCGCTPPPPRSSSGTAARCRRPTTTCWRSRASATTPRRPSRRSPSDAGTSCSTPTSAGSWPGCSAARSCPAPSVTRAERDRAAAVLPEDEPTAATWSIALMELGALVCTARSPRCDELPGQRRTAPGGRPATRRTTDRPGAARPGTAPTGSAAAG